MQAGKKERRQPTRASGVASAPMDLDFVSRRVRRHLNDLERTNYTEPTTGAGNHSQVEDADDATGAAGQDDAAQGGPPAKKRKKTMAVRQLLVYRKATAALVEDSNGSAFPKTKYSYKTAAARPSRFPPLHLCSVCGYKGKYGCQRCGLKYCDLGCRAIHDESRCERR